MFRPGRASPRPPSSGRRWRGAALRHGLRPDRRAALRGPRRRRPVLRPAERQLGVRAGPNPPNLANVTVRIRAAADARQRRPHHEDAAGAERLRVRQRPAVVDSVERRRADDAAVGDGARRLVRRPAPVRRSCRTWTSTGSISARRSCPRTRTRRWPRARPRRVGGRHRPDAAVSGATARSRRRSGWLERTYHSLQLSLQRRFRNGLSFGFNDTIGLYDRQNTTPRLQHAADGTFSIRADQAEADELLGDNNPQAHIIKANFVWDLPDVHGSTAAVEGPRR